jgi:hypothetical protein
MDGQGDDDDDDRNQMITMVNLLYFATNNSCIIKCTVLLNSIELSNLSKLRI